MISKRDVDIESKVSYTKLALKWCKKNLGINTRKRKKLLLEISEKRRKKGNNIYYGLYCCNKNKIVIYINNCDTIYDIISTIIHEYTHYLQSSSLYRYYSKQYYYSQNPYERQAKRYEEKYTKPCFKEIRKTINQ
jgi:Zn-dependent peptidase ImmA (M78 family)